MKKYVRCNEKKLSATEKVYRMIEMLHNEGIDDSEILDYFLDSMYSEDALDVLRKFADMSGIPYER